MRLYSRFLCLPYVFSYLFVIATAVSAQATVVNLESFPYHDPYLATLTARLVGTSQFKPNYFSMPGLKGRDKVSLLEDKDKVDIAYFVPKRPARGSVVMSFIIPGFGGTSSDGQALFLAEQLALSGQVVIVLPNPFSWKFVLGQSTSGLPGHSNDDAKDLYRLMQQTYAHLLSRNFPRANSFRLMGYSLGALNAAYILQEDQKQKFFNFERTVMINPPFGLYYGMQSLDKLGQLSDKISIKQQNELWGYILNKATSLAAQIKARPELFGSLDKLISIDTFKAKFLIGSAFRESLGAAIFASQQINDLGFLHNRGGRFERSLRLAESNSLGFEGYYKSVWSFWAKQNGFQSENLVEYVKSGDLEAVINLLQTAPGLTVFHNQDDFIVDPADITKFSQLLGDRLVLFSRGGHIGNIWFPPVTQAYVKAMN